jgi:thiazole tautomerase (transcriptional regulator TenI)
VRSDVPVIHAVTDDLILARPEFLDRARGVMRALGLHGAIHLRARYATAAALYQLAIALVETQNETGCWLVANDRVDLALGAGLMGAQLTSRSMSMIDARRIAPALPLGASVHTAAEADAAARAGADWVVAGNIFATRSHPGEDGKGDGLITQIVERCPAVCIAIGGIRPEHVHRLRQAGAHGVAAISGIWNAENAEAAAIDYLSAYDA